MLSDAERDLLAEHLERTGEQCVAAVGALTEAQWTFRPRPDVWSMGEIAAHLAVTERHVLTTLQGLLQGPPAPERKAEAEGKDRLILTFTPRRRRAMAAPPEMLPEPIYANAREAAGGLGETRARTLQFVRATQADLRAYFAHHPAFQTLDGYQWLLLVSAHTERHLAQMAEWAQSPDYPHA